jgi:hypothetical protein
LEPATIPLRGFCRLYRQTGPGLQCVHPVCGEEGYVLRRSRRAGKRPICLAEGCSMIPERSPGLQFLGWRPAWRKLHSWSSSPVPRLCRSRQQFRERSISRQLCRLEISRRRRTQSLAWNSRNKLQPGKSTSRRGAQIAHFGIQAMFNTAQRISPTWKRFARTFGSAGYSRSAGLRQ